MANKPKGTCPDCGAALEDGVCAFCTRFDAIMADAPQAGDIAEFYEAFEEVLHT